jgi:hypothetical protein
MDRSINKMEDEKNPHPFWRGGLDDIRWHPLQVPENYCAAGGHPALCQTDLADPSLISVQGFTYDTIKAVGDGAGFNFSQAGGTSWAGGKISP